MKAIECQYYPVMNIHSFKEVAKFSSYDDALAVANLLGKNYQAGSSPLLVSIEICESVEDYRGMTD